MISTVSQIIIAIALWCGQPQRSYSPGIGVTGSHSLSDMVAKDKCQKSLLECLGSKTNRWDGDKLYSCLMSQSWS